MSKKYIVTLTENERQELQRMIKVGKGAARQLSHARLLLKADVSQGEGWSDEAISAALEISVRSIERVRQTFVEDGYEAALRGRKSQRVYHRKLDGQQEAYLVALTCSRPPEGHQRWTMRLLADKMVELEYVKEVSHETISQVLKKMNLNRG